MKEHLETIKLKIANGANKEAIDLLANLPEPVAGLEDDLLFLKSRQRRLENAVLEARISHEDEIVERNTITRSLLDLVVSLETGDTGVYTSQQNDRPIVENLPGVSESRWSKSRAIPGTGIQIKIGWLILAGMLLVVVLAWGISTWSAPHAANVTTVPDLTVRLVFRPENGHIKQTGLAKIAVGKSVSEALPIPSDGIMRFRNIPLGDRDNPIRLELSDVKYTCRVNGQSVPARGTETDLTFYVDLDMQTFYGRVIQWDSKPAAGVEIDVENGLAHAVTDATGNYSVSLPKWDTETIRIILRKNGKVLIDRKAGLDAAVLKELKIPDLLE